MLKHSYVPPEFCIGITIPLLKDSNLDSSNIDNYRAITISPVLSKIFENCLLSLIVRPTLRRLICRVVSKQKLVLVKHFYCCAVQFSILLIMVQQYQLPLLTCEKHLTKLNIMHFFWSLWNVMYLCVSLICLLTGTRMCLPLWGGASLCQNWSALGLLLVFVKMGHCPLYCLLYMLMTLSLVLKALATAVKLLGNV